MQVFVFQGWEYLHEHGSSLTVLVSLIDWYPTVHRDDGHTVGGGGPLRTS